MSVEKKKAMTKKRISRRQMFRSIGTLGLYGGTEEGKSIPGKVRYPWGTVAGATITAADKPVVSDANGKYRISGLAPGTYTLVSQAPFPGYEMQSQTIEVSTNELNPVDFFLISKRPFLKELSTTKTRGPSTVPLYPVCFAERMLSQLQRIRKATLGLIRQVRVISSFTSMRKDSWAKFVTWKLGKGGDNHCRFSTTVRRPASFMGL